MQSVRDVTALEVNLDGWSLHAHGVDGRGDGDWRRASCSCGRRAQAENARRMSVAEACARPRAVR